MKKYIGIAVLILLSGFIIAASFYDYPILESPNGDEYILIIDNADEEDEWEMKRIATDDLVPINDVEGIPVIESGTPSAADVTDIANLLQSTCVMEDYAFEKYFTFNFKWDDVDGRYEFTSTGNGGFGFRNDEDGMQILVPTTAGTEDGPVTYYNWLFGRDGKLYLNDVEFESGGGSGTGGDGAIAVFSNGLQSSAQIDGDGGLSLDEISEDDIDTVVAANGYAHAMGPDANSVWTWWTWDATDTTTEDENHVYPNDTDNTGCWVKKVRESKIQFLIDGGGSIIADGTTRCAEVENDCMIVGSRLLADQSGSVTVDWWVDSYANYPPTSADSITASATPAISTATKDTDTTLSGWTTLLNKDDIICVSVDGDSTDITWVTAVLDIIE
jgi:hypothetical protein